MGKVGSLRIGKIPIDVLFTFGFVVVDSCGFVLLFRKCHSSVMDTISDSVWNSTLLVVGISCKTGDHSVDKTQYICTCIGNMGYHFPILQSWNTGED